MSALVVFLGIVLVTMLICISFLEVKRDNETIVPVLCIMCILSATFGACFGRVNTVSASEYLESPESYQVDTFTVNGVLDHYKVSDRVSNR